MSEIKRSYLSLKQQVFAKEPHSIVPIREQDRYDIMKWRNEQIYHLRQIKPLTEEDQDRYFNTVVAALFDEEKPSQILFSYLEWDRCIGYGGLVHINWADKNAEISFIMDTKLEEKHFQQHWLRYLALIEDAAFKDLELHKIFVYAFDLRPHLYEILEIAGYFMDARLTEHCFFNGAYKDVVIYSKINDR
ncbi:GNAT family N-acetyltransferase [Flagellimonas marinaquae]